MSTYIRDLAQSLLLLDAMAAGPAVVTATVTGVACDFLQADDRCFAIQDVGAYVGAGPTLNGKIQESADGSTNWTDITGATFAQVAAAQNVQVISFDRTKRYLRYVGTIVLNGGTSIALDALIGQQKKYFI
jgi:hypothetical protein